MRIEPLYRRLASAVDARATCERTGNDEWERRHRATVQALVCEYMPSGSGFDSGTQLDWDKSTGEKLVFLTSYHHMDGVGMYDGWSEHTVTVRASLLFGFDMKISGRDRNGIKETIAELFNQQLNVMVDDAALLAVQS
jgi:hypothetical protein